jgi:hypothetical protein
MNARHFAGVPVRVALVSIAMALGLAACAKPTRSVESGATWTVAGTTRLSRLTIAEGAHIDAGPGREVTLVVNGVESGVRPGTYDGDVVLVPTDASLVDYSFNEVKLVHHFRQALFLDKGGVVPAKSVLPAARDMAEHDGVITGVHIKSIGENFNGIYVAGGTHVIRNAVIDFTGNGGNDFAGYGAGVLAVGKGTTAILDGAKIHTRGAARTAVAADQGSHLIVKNSDIQGEDGTLPEGYVANVTPGYMMTVPWMLGLDGNCRATNLLGADTQATYISSTIRSENWGVLSNDISSKPKLTVINSEVKITGKSGYGAYSMAGAHTRFLGSTFDVRDYALIVDLGGSTIDFGASTPQAVAALNTELGLGLSAEELRALPERQTQVHSDRFGAMIHASVTMPTPPATLNVVDGTSFDTGQAVFLVKGVAANINVDGAKGASLNSRNGVLFQVIDSDDPGPVLVNGLLVNQGVYHEPKGLPARIKGFDNGAAHDSDINFSLANIAVKGDVYNAYRDGTGAARMAAPGEGGSAMVANAAAGRNLVLKLDRASITGVISSATARHPQESIGSADFAMLGVVADTPAAPINNGVILSLVASTWTVTGKSYLSSLAIDAASSVVAAPDRKLTMSVNGKAQAIKAGAYKGIIELSVE